MKPVCGKCRSNNSLYRDDTPDGAIFIACLICGNRYPGGEKPILVGTAQKDIPVVEKTPVEKRKQKIRKPVHKTRYIIRPDDSRKLPKGASKIRTEAAIDKHKRYRHRCIDNGLCPHCGKPCAPYKECEERREYKNRRRRVNG